MLLPRRNAPVLGLLMAWLAFARSGAFAMPTGPASPSVEATKEPVHSALPSSARRLVACSNGTMTFMACPSAAIVQSPSTNTWSVTLLNESASSQSGSLSCSKEGQVSSCTLSRSSYSLAGNGRVTITATYTTAAPGPGSVTITATHSQGPVTALLSVNSTVLVTPDAQPVSVAAFNAAATQGFSVTNSSAVGYTYTFSVTCAPPAATACTTPGSVYLASGASTSVSVNYQSGAGGLTGTIRLSAVRSGNSVDRDDGSIELTVAAGGPSSTLVSVSDANPESSVERDLCLTISVSPAAAFECGDLRVIHQLPAVRTLNQNRAPVLLYNSRHAQSAPLVAANVTPAVGMPTPSKVTALFFVKAVDGSWVVPAGASGEWMGSDFVLGQPTRIALGYDAAGEGTRLVDYRFEVTLWDGGTPRSPISAVGQFIMVDRSQSPFGAGWWLAGLEQLLYGPDGAMLWVGGDGSTRKYAQVSTDVWVAPSLDRPDTLKRDGARQRFIRLLPHGVNVEFNFSGQHTATVNRVGHATTFDYDGNGRLWKISVPRLPTQPYVFTYETGRLRIAAPQIGSVLRETNVNLSNGIVTSIQDPDLTTVTFDYGAPPAQRRMHSRTDRRGARARFTYQGIGHVLAHASRDGAWNSPLSEIWFDSVAESQGIGTPNVMARAIPVSDVHTIHNGPRPDSDVNDRTRIWTDRYGAPVRVVNALGAQTLLQRGDERFPALVTQLRAPNGMISWAMYNQRGHIITATQVSPYGDARNATTIYEWDMKWDFATGVTQPEGNRVVLGYDITTGNRLWQEDGRGASSRVVFAYHTGTDAGLLKTVTLPASVAADSFTYDVARGNLERAATPLGSVTEYLTDEVGRTLRVRRQIDGVRWQGDSTVYDIADQIARSDSYGEALNGVAAQRVIVENFYDAEGNLDSLRRSVSPNPTGLAPMTTKWRYDILGRKVAEVAPDMQKDSTRYDAAGNPVEVITRRDNSAGILMQYDALNRLLRRDVPAATYSARSEGLGGMALLNLPATPYPRYALDPTTQLLTIPADAQAFGYDPINGTMVSADNGDARVVRTYYPNGQLKDDSLMIRTYTGADFSRHRYGLTHRYDRNGRRLVSKHPRELAPRVSGAVKDSARYEYDLGAGYLNRAYDVLGNQYNVLLNSRNERIRTTLPGGIVDSAGYDASGRMISHRIMNSAGVFYRRDTLAYDRRDKVLRSDGKAGFADTTLATYSGLGHAIRHIYFAPAMNGFGNPVRISSVEDLQLDPLGNTYGDQITSTVSSSGSTRRSNELRQAAFQTNTGRLDITSDMYRVAVYRYDNAGNTVFMKDSTFVYGTAVEDRASFYSIDGKLRVAETRRANTQAGVGSQYWSWNGTFEEYRYDALGRRVLVRTRPDCSENPIRMLGICRLAVIRRTVWDGSEELYEIQMPGGNERTADQLENDTLLVQRPPATADDGYTTYFDSNPLWGRVAYLHLTGIDAPVAITRINYEDDPWNKNPTSWQPFTVNPHWNWRAQAAYGTFGVTGTAHCSPGDTVRCIQVLWRKKAFAFSTTTQDTVGSSWVGTLITDKEDGAGTFYRRNRYVDANTGRFTQEDPIGLAGGLNLYGFAAGDPVNFSDPMGLCPPETAWTPDCDVPLQSAGFLDPIAWLSGGLTVGWAMGARLFARQAARASAAATARSAVPTATNRALQNTVNQLFRPGDKLAGGTAGAIRQEALTGRAIGGKFHLQKGIERIRNLEHILAREELSAADRALAERLLSDLRSAVRLFEEMAARRAAK